MPANPTQRTGQRITAAQRRAGLIALAALTAVVLLWVRELTLLAYPFRLLLTIVHELSHGVAAMVTGGRFGRFVVFPDGSGLAYTAGGWRALVIPAGYLGAALFGAAMIVAGRTLRGGRAALITVGAVVGLLTLRFSLPTLVTGEALAGLLTTVAGLALGAALLWVGLRAGAAGVVYTVHLIGIAAGLTAFADLWTLVGLSADGAAVATDARSMAELTLVPAVVWALAWALAAALLLAAAVRWAWKGG